MVTPSPCIRNCCLNHDEVCLGCFRTLHEITQWTYLSDEEKQAVISQARRRQEEHENRFGRWK